MNPALHPADIRIGEQVVDQVLDRVGRDPSVAVEDPDHGRLHLALADRPGTNRLVAGVDRRALALPGVREIAADHVEPVVIDLIEHARGLVVRAVVDDHDPDRGTA